MNQTFKLHIQNMCLVLLEFPIDKRLMIKVHYALPIFSYASPLFILFCFLRDTSILRKYSLLYHTVLSYFFKK